MEQTQALAKSNAFNFVEESMQTLDGAIKYANMLLSSKLCPRHFYELVKDPKDRWVPDYKNGKPEAVLIVLQHGKEVGMSISQSLQQIIPVNGLISIKGDGAKSLIFSSGKLEKNSWKETTTGTIAGKDYRVSITAKRSDNGEELTRSFSVEAAMRAGLWVTDAKLKGQDAWKYKLSPWYRYPERMIKYRTLGFISRDLFPDVLMGMITKEEAEDYPVDEGTLLIEKPDGSKLKIEQPAHKVERSQEVTDNAVEKIDKALGNGNEKVKTDPAPKKYTEKQLLNMGSTIYRLAATIKTGYEPEPLNALLDSFPGKKSNKKYREAILAIQDGKFDDILKKYGMTPPGSQDADIIEDRPPEGPPADATDESGKTDDDIKKENEQSEFDKKFDGGKADDGSVKEKASEPNITNKQGIEIPELGELESREFEGIKKVYDELNTLGVNNDRWTNITKGHKFGEQFTNKEDFCRRATVIEINELLNSL